MSAENNDIAFALSFPQGVMLFLKNQGIYFKPHKGPEAFMVWGEHKELFGKHAVIVKGNNAAYSLVYEFSAAGALTDARLVKGETTLQGALVDQPALQDLRNDLAAGEIILYSVHDMQPDSVFNVAQFPDGRLLIQLMNKNELYLGTPGHYTKLDARLVMQGGNSMYYKTSAGEKIDLPYGFGGPGFKDVPKFDGVPLAYLKIESSDPAAFGLEMPQKVVVLNPFSSQLAEKKPPSPRAGFPKP